MYVENRVRHIRELGLTKQWKYVETTKNPADLLSRGVKAIELLGNHWWWTGPHFFNNEDSLISNDTNEKIEMVSLLTNAENDKAMVFDISDYSSLLKSVRVFAYLKRLYTIFRKR